MNNRPVYCKKFFDQFKKTTWQHARKSLSEAVYLALKDGDTVYSPSENLYFTVAPLLSEDEAK